MTKEQLDDKFQRWTTLTRKRERIETERSNQLETLLDIYEKKAEPINSAADKQLDAFADELLQLEEEIRTEMLASVKADGSIGIQQLENKFALAQVLTNKKREIDSAAFLRAVPPARRLVPGFFECISILIAPSEKFLDAVTMQRLAKFKLSRSVSLSLKATN